MGMALVMKYIIMVTVKEEQGNAVLAIHFAVKALNQLYITNTSILKVGACAVCIVRLTRKAEFQLNTCNFIESFITNFKST